MTASPAVAAALLAYAAATDNRNVTEEAARAWADALDDTVTMRDGKAAIVAHRRTSTDYLMPIHINTEVRRIRRRRVDAIGPVNPPDALTVAETITWLRSYARAVGDGGTPDEATVRACAAIGVEVPALIEGTRRMPDVGHLARRVPVGEP